MVAVVGDHPHAVVYSLDMDPELSLLAELRRVAPGTSFILLGREFTPELAHHGIELGVRGFLNTTASPDTVRECIRHSAAGQLWMERPLYNSLLDARPVPLSRRQSELLGLLIQGLKNREIGLAMGISEGTVKAYLTKLFEKVGARDRFELALYGLKHLRTAPEAEFERDARIRAQKRSAAPFVA
jgi:DNA-binding NarL/FixJ family response regulator